MGFYDAYKNATNEEILEAKVKLGEIERKADPLLVEAWRGLYGGGRAMLGGALNTLGMTDLANAVKPRDPWFEPLENPTRLQSIFYHTGNALGTTLFAAPAALAGPAAPIAAGAMYMTATYQDSVDEYLKQGVPEDRARAGAFLKTYTSAGVESILGYVPGMGKAIKNTLKIGGKGATKATQNTIKKALSEKIVNKVTEKYGMRTLAKIAMGGAGNTAEETVEELTQLAIELGVDSWTTGEDIPDNAVEMFADTLVATAETFPLGLGFSTINHFQTRGERKSQNAGETQTTPPVQEETQEAQETQETQETQSAGTPTELINANNKSKKKKNEKKPKKPQEAQPEAKIETIVHHYDDGTDMEIDRLGGKIVDVRNGGGQSAINAERVRKGEAPLELGIVEVKDNAPTQETQETQETQAPTEQTPEQKSEESQPSSNNELHFQETPNNSPGAQSGDITYKNAKYEYIGDANSVVIIDAKGQPYGFITKTGEQHNLATHTEDVHIPAPKEIIEVATLIHKQLHPDQNVTFKPSPEKTQETKSQTNLKPNTPKKPKFKTPLQAIKATKSFVKKKSQGLRDVRLFNGRVLTDRAFILQFNDKIDPKILEDNNLVDGDPQSQAAQATKENLKENTSGIKEINLSTDKMNEILSTQNESVEIGGKNYDSDYMRHLIKAIDNPKFNNGVFLNNDILFIEGDNASAVLMPLREEKPNQKQTPKPKHKTKPEVKPETKTEVKPEIKPEPKPEVKPETKTEVKPEIKPEVKPEPKPEVKPETKPEVKPETKPEVKPETKPEVKPEVKPETKTEPKPEPKPTTSLKRPAHITEERWNELMARKAETEKKLQRAINTTLGAGINPEIFVEGVKLGAIYFEIGIVKFQEFALEMLNTIGQNVKPFIKGIYENVRRYPGMEEYAKDMTPTAEVDAFDLDSLTNEQPNPFPFPNPNPEPDAKPTPEPTPEPDTKPEPEPDTKPEPEPKPEPTPEPTPEPKPETKERPGVEQNFDLFHYSQTRDFYQGTSSGIVRTKSNVAAVKVLKKIKAENRAPTQAEKEILSKFSGWGGTDSLYQFLNREGLELKDIGFDNERDYEIAKKTQYFTPPRIITRLWQIVEKLGFKGGEILESSAGVGNIIGMMPRHIMENSTIKAVELEQVTGEILHALYPSVDLSINSFENLNIPDNSISLAITNVPFSSQILVSDPYERELTRRFRSSLHDYFIAKNVKKLREGGIGIFITSSSSINNGANLLSYLNDSGTDVIGVFRLANNTFVGAKVTTDILVVQKRINGEVSKNAIPYAQLINQQVVREVPILIGKEEKSFVVSLPYYFVANPQYMGGIVRLGYEENDTYRPQSQHVVETYESMNSGGSQNERLEKWVKDGVNGKFEEIKNDKPDKEGIPTKEPTGKIFIDDNGKFYISVENGRAIEVVGKNKSPYKFATAKNRDTHREMVKDYNALAEQAKATLKNNTPESREKLNSLYDSFVKKYGTISTSRKLLPLRDDIDFSLVAGLETQKKVFNKETKKYDITYEKADILTKSFEVEPSIKVETIQDAMLASILTKGGADVDFIADSLNRKEKDKVRQELLEQELVFEEADGSLTPSHVYLSGNVRKKLKEVKAINTDGRFDRNVKALEKVMPKDKDPLTLSISLGCAFVPNEVYSDFLRQKINASVSFTHNNARWTMVYSNQGISTEKWYYINAIDDNLGVRSSMLEKSCPYSKLVYVALNGGTVVEFKGKDSSGEYVVDQNATNSTKTQIAEIKEEFQSYVIKRMTEDESFAKKIGDYYNERFNCHAPMVIPDSYLIPRFPGQNTQITLRPQQIKGTIKALFKNTLLAHEVGSGKTFTLLSAALEMKRLGIAKKPMLVVHNPTIGGFVRDARKLYPNARILVVDDLSAHNRRVKIAQMAYNDWDLIIIPQSKFDMIPDSQERQRAWLETQINDYVTTLLYNEKELSKMDEARFRSEIRSLEVELARALQGEDIKTDPSKKKDAEKKDSHAVAAKNAGTRMKESLAKGRKDKVLNFEEIGIDALLVDEAHAYKNLSFPTAIKNVKGMTGDKRTARSLGLLLKADALNERGGRIVLATGTPISNSVCEVFTFMRYLKPVEERKEFDIYYFDDFIRNFGSIESQLEFKTNGQFALATRLSAFHNVPELVKIWGDSVDTALSRDIEEVKKALPEVRSMVEEGKRAHTEVMDMPYETKVVFKKIIQEAKRYERLAGDEKRKFAFIPLTLYTAARCGAVDPRLVFPELSVGDYSKIGKIKQDILTALRESEDRKGTVAVMSDLHAKIDNEGNAFDYFIELKNFIIDAGYTCEIVDGSLNDKQRENVFDRVRNGDTRVIIGSTQRIGVGVNMQDRLYCLIHVDVPQRPMDVEQRDARILRQGNMHKELGIPIMINRYAFKNSLDVTAYSLLGTKAKFIEQMMSVSAAYTKGDMDAVNSVTTIEEDDGNAAELKHLSASIAGSNSLPLLIKSEQRLNKLKAKKINFENIAIAKERQLKDAKNRKDSYERDLDKYKEQLSNMEKILPNGSKWESLALSISNANTIDATATDKASFNELCKKANERITEVRNDVASINTLESTKKIEFTLRVNDKIPVIISVEINKASAYADDAGKYQTSTRFTAFSSENIGLNFAPLDSRGFATAMEDLFSLLGGEDLKEKIKNAKTQIKFAESLIKQLNSIVEQKFSGDEEIAQLEKDLEELGEKAQKEVDESLSIYDDVDISDLPDIAFGKEKKQMFDIVDELDDDSVIVDNETRRVYNRTKKLLEKAGINVVEKINDIGDESTPILSTGGNILGWTDGESIFLTHQLPRTAMHEYTHLWASALQQADAKKWDEIVALLRDTPVFRAVKNDANYQHLETDSEIADEALARLSGIKNAERLYEYERTGATKRALLSMKKALRRFWRWVASLFGKNITTADDITQDVFTDFIGGKKITPSHADTRFSIENQEYRQVNPMLDPNTATFQDYENFLDAISKQSSTDEEIRLSASLNIIAQGGVDGAIENILKGDFPIEGADDVIAYRTIMNTKEFADLEFADQEKIRQIYHTRGSNVGRELRSRRRDVFDITDHHSVQHYIRSHLSHAPNAQEIIKKIQVKYGVDLNNLPKNVIEDLDKLHDIALDIVTATAPMKNKIYEYWINAILSGVKTHVANTTGNIINFARYATTKYIEASINMFTKNPELSSFKEFSTISKILDWKSIWKNAWDRASFSYKYELLTPDAKLDNVHPAISGKKGKIIRTPTKILKFADELIKGIIVPLEAYSMAYRLGQKRKLKKDALIQYMKQQVSSANTLSMRHATNVAKILTFQEDLTGIPKALMHLKTTNPLIGYLLPFVKTPINILRQGVRYSPLGSLKMLYLLGKNKGKLDTETTRRLAEQILSLSLTMAVSSLVGGEDDDDLPIFTGASAKWGSSEQKFKQDKIPPMSIRVGDVYYSYARIEPFATQLGIIVDAVRHVKDLASGKDAEKVLKSAFNSARQIFTDKSYLSGISEILNLVTDPEKEAIDTTTNFIASWLPNIIRQPLTNFSQYATDNKVRDYGVDYLTQSGTQTIPGRMGFVQPAIKRDYLGRKIKRDDSNPIFRSLIPVAVVDASKMNRIDQMFINYNRNHLDDPAYPSMGNWRFGDKYMDTTQYEMFCERSGKLAERRLQEAINRGEINIRRPSKADIEYAKEILKDARSEVRKQMVKEKKFHQRKDK